VSPASSYVSSSDGREDAAPTPSPLSRSGLVDADEAVELLFTMHDASDWSPRGHGASVSSPATEPAQPTAPTWLRSQASFGACLYHKQQSGTAGQLRDGTTRAVLDVPLPSTWHRRLLASLDAHMLSSLEQRDRRKHALGLYTLGVLSAAGVRISFHPLDALHVSLSQRLFDDVRGKASREPLLLLYLSKEQPVLSVHVYRGNLPLSRDVRAAHQLRSGLVVLRVCLWDAYEAMSVPFEVKAKQHEGESAGAVTMNGFTEVGQKEAPAGSPRAAVPLEFGALSKRRRLLEASPKTKEAASSEA
jgi:hypothetical protein